MDGIDLKSIILLSPESESFDIDFESLFNEIGSKIKVKKKNNKFKFT